jgi:hypothetical protein
LKDSATDGQNDDVPFEPDFRDDREGQQKGVEDGNQ